MTATQPDSDGTATQPDSDGTATQPDSDGTATQTDHGLTRRGVMRKTAIGIGATATAGVGLSGRGPSPVGEAEAIAPLALAAGAAIAGGAGVGAGWLVRSVDPLGADEVEGQTADSMMYQVTTAAMARASNNKSTFTDNENIVQYAEDTAYTEAKVAALDRTGEGLSESALYNAALDPVNEHESVVQSNLIKSWNESCRALQSWIDAYEDHPDITLPGAEFDRFRIRMYHNRDWRWEDVEEYETNSREHTLPNGDTITVEQMDLNQFNDYMYDLESADGFTGWGELRVSYEEFEAQVNLLSGDDSTGFDSIWDDIVSVFDSVRENLETWIANVFDDIGDGSVDVGEVAGPRALASLASDDETMPEAAADLRALGIPVDTDREAEIYLDEMGVTLYGQLGVSGDYTLTVGETIDPSSEDESFYLTYDTARASGVWPAENYDANLAEGTLTFSEAPLEGVLYRVTNTDDETAELSAADFEANAEPYDDPTEWTVELSEQLENASGTVLEIEYFSESGETNFETIQLTAPFDIVSITDAEGEEITEAIYERGTPQDDTNYITQDEWDDIDARNQELIDKYEESQTSFGAGGFLDGDASDIRTLGIVAGGAALAALLFGNN